MKGFVGVNCSMLFCSAMVFDECKNLLLKALVLLYTAATYKYLYVKVSFLACSFQELNWTITNFTIVQGSFVRICISCGSYHWTNKDIGHNMHTESYCELLHKMQKKLVN